MTVALIFVVQATVLYVHDGDTFRATAYPWPAMEITETVRVTGIDTPELRARCPRERELAVRARDQARDLIDGKTVILEISGRGKYGRLLVRVRLEDGSYLGQRLEEAGLAREYHGGPREGWCD